MNSELKRRFDSLGTWYHNFSFEGVNSNEDKISSEEIYQALRSLFCDRIEECVILDIGCSCGYYSVRLAMENAGKVIGIEKSCHRIDQASFVKDYFLKTERDKSKVSFFCDNFQDYLKNTSHTDRYEYILAMSVLYYQKDLYEVAKMFTYRTHSIIARWRRIEDGADENKSGKLFYDELKKFDFVETERKEFGGRDFVRYNRKGPFRLIKNHNLLFSNDPYTRDYDEIIRKVTGTRHPVVWSRLAPQYRKDFKDFIIHVKPNELLHRDFGPDFEVVKRNKQNLIESVKAKGLLCPLGTVRRQNGYRVLDGNHRSGISKMLNFDKVAIIALEEYDSHKNLIL
jgi:hypothetical protein